MVAPIYIKPDTYVPIKSTKDVSNNSKTICNTSKPMAPAISLNTTILFCWHCHTISLSKNPHPMNRARRWYTVVTLLYDLCIGRAILIIQFDSIGPHVFVDLMSFGLLPKVYSERGRELGTISSPIYLTKEAYEGYIQRDQIKIAKCL